MLEFHDVFAASHDAGNLSSGDGVEQILLVRFPMHLQLILDVVPVTPVTERWDDVILAGLVGDLTKQGLIGHARHDPADHGLGIDDDIQGLALSIPDHLVVRDDPRHNPFGGIAARIAGPMGFAVSPHQENMILGQGDAINHTIVIYPFLNLSFLSFGMIHNIWD